MSHSTNEPMDVDKADNDTSTNTTNTNTITNPSATAATTTTNPSTQSNGSSPSASASGSSSSSSSTASKEMGSAKKAALQQKLKAKISGYRRLVVSGCGNWQCLNEFCKSNLANRDRVVNDKMASTMAVKMVKLKHSDCRSFGLRSIDALKYEKLKILEMDGVDESKESSDPALSAAEQDVVRAFKEWHHFYGSFCTENAVTKQDVAVDFDEMDRVFTAILCRVQCFSLTLHFIL